MEIFIHFMFFLFIKPTQLKISNLKKRGSRNLVRVKDLLTSKYTKNNLDIKFSLQSSGHGHNMIQNTKNNKLSWKPKDNNGQDDPIKLLTQILKSGNFLKDHEKILKILIKALETGKLTNEKNKETFQLLGKALSSFKLTDKEYPKTLKLFGDAILNGLITDNKHKETLIFLAEVLKHKEASDEMAFNRLTKMLRRCYLSYKKKSIYKAVKNKEAIQPVDNTNIIDGSSFLGQYENNKHFIKGDRFSINKFQSFCENQKGKYYVNDRSKVNSDTLNLNSLQNNTILSFTVSRRKL